MWRRMWLNVLEIIKHHNKFAVCYITPPYMPLWGQAPGLCGCAQVRSFTPDNPSVTQPDCLAPPLPQASCQPVAPHGLCNCSLYAQHRLLLQHPPRRQLSNGRRLGGQLQQAPEGLRHALS